MRIIKLNNQIKKRFIFLLIIFACFSASIFLISYSLNDQIAYFVEPTDLKSMDGIENKYLRVGGLVKKNSLKFIKKKISVYLKCGLNCRKKIIVYNKKWSIIKFKELLTQL